MGELTKAATTGHARISDAVEPRVPTITLDAAALNDAADEVQRARKKHAPMRSAHEAYSVILEEMDEFWDEVKKKSENRSPERMAEELVQIAAMALRARVDLGLILRR